MNDLSTFPVPPSVILAVILLVVAILVILAGIKTVPQGEAWTIERFGRFTRVLRPGLNLLVPFIDRVGQRQNMMERVLDVPTQEIITRDNAMVQTDGVVFFQILDAARASYEVQNLELAMQNLAVTNLRSVMGAMDLDELLSNRDAINAKLLQIVDEATQPWGVKITRVEIRDIQPPADLVAAMAKQMTAERERRAAILKAEGDKQGAILRAEGEKQSRILEAEGRREAAFRDAEARERSAQAEGEATRVVSEAIAAGSTQAINYFVAQKYVEALQAIGSAHNEKIVFLPLDTTGVLGALGGIQELTRSLGGGSGGAARPITAPVAPRPSTPPSTSAPASPPQPWGPRSGEPG